MKITSLVVAAAMAAVSSARIIGFAVPQTIKPGQEGFSIKVLTENYIQSVQDIAFAIGISPSNRFTGGTLGSTFGSYYLGPEQSNVLYNVTKWATLPASTIKGQATITAAFFSLYGASSSQTLTTYNVTVTVGDSTSSTYVSSLGRTGS